MEKIILKRAISERDADLLEKNFLEEDCFDRLVTSDCDGFDTKGKMLFRFRKNAIPPEILLLGYDSFKDSIQISNVRGAASGWAGKRVRKDGSITNTGVGAPVESTTVGYMDSSAMVRYCRKTAFAHNYFEKFTAGIPFVKCVDQLYKELCPVHYAAQKAIADATNRNYVIADTSFTTVTVNKNFQTAVHKDAGDLPAGFGNLCVYREGHYEGAYFCLPEFRVAIDLQNCDMLFVDVHRWHGNTPFKNCSKDYLRMSFVMYYREYMIQCKQPAEELKRVQNDQGGFYKI